MDSRILLIAVLVGFLVASRKGAAASSNFNDSTSRDARTFGGGLGIGLGGGFGQPMNTACTTQSKVTGTCMRRLECLRNRGVASGFCGAFGVCCELNLECNDISKSKRTVIRSPSNLPRKCTYHIQAFSKNVCQIRVDFDLNLAQPTIPSTENNLQAVTCVRDTLQIGDLTLCGSNTKQHIYVPFDAATGASDFSMSFSLADRTQGSAAPAFWNLVVTQLECAQPAKRTSGSGGLITGTFPKLNQFQDFTSLLRPPVYDTDLIAPAGCLQYFTEREGTIESFNFNNGEGIYFGNLKYAICFKRTEADIGVQLTASAFTMSFAEELSGYVDSDCHDLLGTPGRKQDYLLIAESILATVPPYYATHYCGTSLLNVPVLHSPPGPFAIYFNSDDLYSAPETGFRMTYSIQ